MIITPGDGITFNGKHSYNDMVLVKLDHKSYTIPNRNEITVSVPFMNGCYDFSNIYGGATYSDRTLEYEFAIDVRDLGLNDLDTERILIAKKMKIENWLMQSNSKTELIDDSLTGYYYLAKCDSIDFDSYFSFGTFKVSFIAYPFKIRDEYEGNLLWDTFNFELDTMQDTVFTIEETKRISIYNQSATKIVPTIECSSEMIIIKDNIAYNIPAGTIKDCQFEFKIGKNDMRINGNGTIEFKFRKEVL